jgi:release factor glutamine methyltransferase
LTAAAGPLRDDGPSTSPCARSDVVARLRAAGCVFAEDEAEMLVAAARTPAELSSLVGRRVAGLPLEHVLGWADFCGLRVTLEPGVFVPRRRSEFLVRRAADLLRRSSAEAGEDQGASWTVVDLCCGSGAVGAALMAAEPRIELHAVDTDPAAVRCARRNVGTGARVYVGDLYAPLPARLRGRVDVVVANAPYVPRREIELLPPEARVHEPAAALDGGEDGLDVIRRIAAGASAWLAPGGHLLAETSERQGPSAARAFAHHALHARVARSKGSGATVVVGARPTPPYTGPTRSPSG